MCIFFGVKFLLKEYKFLDQRFEIERDRLLVFYSKHIYTVGVFHGSFFVQAIEKILYITVFLYFDHQTNTFFRRLVADIVNFIKYFVFRQADQIF